MEEDAELRMGFIYSTTGATPVDDGEWPIHSSGSRDPNAICFALHRFQPFQSQRVRVSCGPLMHNNANCPSRTTPRRRLPVSFVSAAAVSNDELVLGTPGVADRGAIACRDPQCGVACES